MKLNADIIYNGLSRHFQCEIHGPRLTELTLGRAEFYLDGETSFVKDRLYLASIDHLPKRPHIQNREIFFGRTRARTRFVFIWRRSLLRTRRRFSRIRRRALS